MSSPKTVTLPNGLPCSSLLPRPFLVRLGYDHRSFGSIEKARAYAQPGATIFFETSPGTGRFLERVGG